MSQGSSKDWNREGGRDQRSNDKRSGGNRAKPWNVHYCRNYTDGDGKEQTQFLLCGVAFPMKNREGFSIELYFPLEPHQRLVIMPRDEKNNGG